MAYYEDGGSYPAEVRTDCCTGRADSKEGFGGSFERIRRTRFGICAPGDCSSVEGNQGQVTRGAATTAKRRAAAAAILARRQ